MSLLVLLISAGIIMTVCPSDGVATDWVFKGQPKDGGETYGSSETEATNRAQRLKLLADCDHTSKMFRSLGKSGLSDREVRRSAILGLSSCGLVYGADHQREKSTECLNQALELSQSSDSAEKAQILNYLGIVHALWGQFPRALDYHNRSLSLKRGPGPDLNEATSYNQIGHIAMFMGDYRKASDALEKSLAIQSAGPDKKQMWLTLDNLGQLNEAWGNSDKALEYYQRALELKKVLGFTGGQVASLVQLGRVYKIRGQDEKALEYFEEGLKTCQKYGYPTDLILDQIGNVYLDRGDAKKAEEYIKKACFRQSLGRLHLMKGDPAGADRYYTRLLRYSESRRMPDYGCVAHTGLGLVDEQKGNLQSAADHFRTAIENTEAIRSSLSQAERAEFFNVQVGGFFRTAPYKGLARVLIKMNRPADAFRESEFTKARTFSESLSRQSTKPMMGVPSDVLRTDAELNQELAAITRALFAAYEREDGESVSFLEPQVKIARQRLESHVASLRPKYPLFAAGKYPEPMHLNESAVNPGEWILAYDVTDLGVIIYLLKGKTIVGTSFRAIPKTELDRLVRKFREPMEIDSNDTIAEKLRRYDFKSGKKLFDLLIGEIAADLPPNKHLIIIPDGPLGLLPFEALTTNDGGKIEEKGEIVKTSGASFFGDRNPITYYQSVTALSLSRSLRARQNISGRMLAIVDPVFSIDDSRFVRIGREKKEKLETTYPSQVLMSIKQGTGITFPRLSLTGELGEKLKKDSPSATDLYEGLQACKEVLTAKDLTAYDSIVLATHGYFGNDLPGIKEPVLVLTQFDETKDGDGFLRLSEAAGLKLAADIVALTACRTGLGRQISGEGTAGMGRAFQCAGARSVMMSLWSVAESSSVKLVESFFNYRRAGKKNPEAFKSAKDGIRGSGFDHPFFWAAFILVGDIDE